jgi:hypothetical protein
MQALKGKRKYSSYSILISALDWVSGQRHAPAALYTRERAPSTPPPMDRKLRGPQCWSGQRLERKSFASAEDGTPVVQSVVRHDTELSQIR